MKFASQHDYATAESVSAEYPYATEIVEVDGGWVVFETSEDAETWRNQK